MDYTNWKIVRTSEGQAIEDNLTKLVKYIGTIGDTRPSWVDDEYVS